MKKRVLTLVLASALVAATVAGCGKLDGSEVVAEVGDAKITADVANFYARYKQAQYETYYASFLGEDMWSGEAEEGKTYEESVKEGVLESLETMYILDAHKDDYGVSLTDEENEAIEKAAKSFTESNNLEDKDMVSGDEETVKKFLELVTIQEKMHEAMTADVDTEVSDEEAAQKSMQYVYFSFTKTDDDGNSTQLSEDEKAELKETVEAFREGAVNAEDFAAYAEEAGYTASTLTFDTSTTSPSQLLVVAADSLKEGEVTPVVEDTSGYFVAKLTSLLDRDATDAKKESIVSERKEEQFDKLCEEWKEADGVKVHKNVWDKISFVKRGVTIKDTDE